MARKKRAKKIANKVIAKIRKAPKIKKASKPVQKAIKKAISSNKGKKLKITKKEIKRIISKGATKKQIQRIRKVASKSKKLNIGKKVDTKKEVKKTFIKQRKAGNAPGAKNNGKGGSRSGSGGGRDNNRGSGNNSGNGSGNNSGNSRGNKNNNPFNPDLNSVDSIKAPGKGWKPKAVENSVASQWDARFNNYKGPKRLKVKRPKAPDRLAEYSVYDKKTDEYKGFDTKQYRDDLRKDLRKRYKDSGGKIQDKDKIDRMIKRDGPKANFDVKPKYSKTMDKLKDQLGGDVNYKKTLGSVTKSLSQPPKVKARQLKNVGLSILKPRTTEDVAVNRPTTIRKKSKTTK